jgi:HEAT repeat protein
MPGLGGLVDHLEQLLAQPGEDSVVRRSAAKALVELDARGKADVLVKAADTGGLEVAQFVEPALAKWGHAGLNATWLQRLEDPAHPRLSRWLALRCVSATGDAAAIPAIRKMVHDPHTARTLRLAAAQSLGSMCDEGLLDDARRLVADNSPAATFDRILGMTLLVRHSGSDAQALLRELATDAEPSVAAAAFTRLFAIDPALTYELAPRAIANADANVRFAGARSLVARSDADSVALLSRLLDDPNLTLRRWTTKSLVELARQSGLRAAVVAASENMLVNDRWRGLEQATMLAVMLEHSAVAPRMIELLSHRRPEVSLAACFALRKFRLPDTWPVMLEFATRQHKWLTTTNVLAYQQQLVNGQHAQLFQAFGEVRFREAEPLMRKFVPKNFTFGNESRAAACWALGYLHEGREDAELVDQFVGRLTDTFSDVPEVTEVRRMCAVSLGRMKATSALSVLDGFATAEGPYTEIGQACAWAVEQISGKPRPALAEVTQQVIGWFLDPFADSGK